MSESPRLDRIEKIVISLEADMKIMANSVASMATSMEKFVEMQTDHKLLKQEMKYNCESVTSKIDDIKKRQEITEVEVEECKAHYQKDIVARFKDLEVVIFFATRPKMFLVFLLGFYLLAIQEVRETVKAVLPFF